MLPNLDACKCSRARHARDARFDGLFFVGVHSTGIYCRPICPATPAKEAHVSYYESTLAASEAGLRPCLRCRPESAPGSPAWRGTQTTLARALRLIDAGEWRGQPLPEFAQRLGITDRYLRQLFYKHLGVSPLKYANYQRALFAKRLLQETTLPVTAIADIAGFSSVRRFNTVFAETTGLNPRRLRADNKKLRNSMRGDADRQAGDNLNAGNYLTLFLAYRPPYDWRGIQQFFETRQIPGLEQVTRDTYSRSFDCDGNAGFFIATHRESKNGFEVKIFSESHRATLAVSQGIRRVLDLDANSTEIDQHLHSHPALAKNFRPGQRLPGVWSAFEAGARAILGQQVSVKAARNLVTTLVEKLGARTTSCSNGYDGPRLLFPSPNAVARSRLDFLAMPQSRRKALRALARYFVTQTPTRHTEMDTPRFDDWLQLPGVGPWTCQYAAMRMGHPDIFLAGDLGVKNAVKQIQTANTSQNTAEAIGEALSPWGSYATLALWSSLNQ